VASFIQQRGIRTIPRKTLHSKQCPPPSATWLPSPADQRDQPSPANHEFNYSFVLHYAPGSAKSKHYTKIRYKIQNTLIQCHKISIKKSVKSCYAHPRESGETVSDEANESQIFSRTVRSEILNEVIR